MGTFFEAYGQADFFGKLIFFALFLLSCLCWVFLIKKFLLLKQIRRHSKGFHAMALKKREMILSLPPYPPSPFYTIYQTLKEKTVEILDKNLYFTSEKAASKNYLSRADIELIDSHLLATVMRLRVKIEKNLFVLSTTVTLAPFIGLLGTVWGILLTFSELQAGHFATSNRVILGGLSTALTSTVLGLLIAIPALIAYNCLKNMSRHFTLEMEDFSHFLLSTIELQYRKVDFR